MYIHVISKFDSKDGKSKLRHQTAENTWWHLYNNGVKSVPIANKMLTRSSKDLGDDRDLPYVKDLFDKAIELEPSATVIIFCNSDICLTNSVYWTLEAALRNNAAVYSPRIDVDSIISEMITADLLKLTEMTWGADFFAFTVDWWRKVREHFPDMILACEQWDMLLMAFMQLTNPSPKIQAISYHEKHDSYWKDDTHRYSNPGQLNNLLKSGVLFHKLMLLATMQQITWNPEKLQENFRLKHHVDSLYMHGFDLFDAFINDHSSYTNTLPYKI